MKLVRISGVIGLLWMLGVWWTAPACAAGTPLMVEKNLFSQDRKPPSPEAAASTPQPNRPSVSVKSIQLDGILFFGDERKALLRVKGPMAGSSKGKQTSPYTVVREGAKVGDYKVLKIESKAIQLEKDGQIETIALFAEGKVSPPLPAAPSPPQAAQEAPQPQPQAAAPPGKAPVPHPQRGVAPGTIAAGLLDENQNPNNAEENFMQNQEPFEEDSGGEEGE